MLVWFFVGTCLILLELLTPTFIFLFFGLGAWGAALMAQFYPGLPQELAAFMGVTILSLVLLRKKMQETFKGFQGGKHGNAPPQTFAYIGKTAKVTKEISPQQEGEIFVGGSFWRATASESCHIDSLILIVKQDEEDNTLLHVQPQK